MNSGRNCRWVPLIIRTLILNFVDNKILIKNKSNDLHILNVFLKKAKPFFVSTEFKNDGPVCCVRL